MQIGTAMQNCLKRISKILETMIHPNRIDLEVRDEKFNSFRAKDPVLAAHHFDGPRVRSTCNDKSSVSHGRLESWSSRASHGPAAVNVGTATRGSGGSFGSGKLPSTPVEPPVNASRNEALRRLLQLQDFLRRSGWRYPSEDCHESFWRPESLAGPDGA